MVRKIYYVDSCIWLNLFKEEGDPTKGIPYWLLAKSFIEGIMFSEEDEIIYTGFVLKEIRYKLNDEKLFQDRLEFLRKEPKFRFVKATPEDYDLARKLESEFKFEISFFDCIHIAICKRLNAHLVTRDQILIEASKKYILVDKPENLFS
ncbi:MAG: PIN domain-containing protein [Nanoarchaeota archaeon]